MYWSHDLIDHMITVIVLQIQTHQDWPQFQADQSIPPVVFYTPKQLEYYHWVMFSYHNVISDMCPLHGNLMLPLNDAGVTLDQE